VADRHSPQGERPPAGTPALLQITRLHQTLSRAYIRDRGQANFSGESSQRFSAALPHNAWLITLVILPESHTLPVSCAPPAHSSPNLPVSSPTGLAAGDHRRPGGPRGTSGARAWDNPDPRVSIMRFRKNQSNQAEQHKNPLFKKPAGPNAGGPRRAGFLFHPSRCSHR